ncbi:MAG: hypothetical protein KF799_08625 [Bdellovibrionales bacterium]|nr:hypothetical protein [Bdellovibrionales bacterium]
MLNKILLAFLSAAILASVSCNSEQDDLAKAQQCLDELDVSVTNNKAEECLQYIDKYDSQQAKILKCSIYMTSGGLVESKIVNAYKALKEDTQANKHATYMTLLSLDNPTATLALPKAQNANAYCQASGVPGLQYLSNAILVGTSLNATIESFNGGSGIDPTDTTAMNNMIESMLTTCTDPAATPTDKAKCAENLETMGSAALALSTTYCDSTEADKDVCGQINGAVQSAGVDPANIGQALICYLKDLKFDANTGTCATN